MCLMVIGNYGLNFRPGLNWLQTQVNFLGVIKLKMKILVFSLPLKKSKQFLIFVLQSYLG